MPTILIVVGCAVAGFASRPGVLWPLVACGGAALCYAGGYLRGRG